MTYKLTYWSGSGSLPHDWYKDLETVARLEKVRYFDTSNEAEAKAVARGKFLRTNSDGVQLEKKVEFAGGAYVWENVLQGGL